MNYPDLNPDQKLLAAARNLTSLSGEDGIIARIFEIVSPMNRWCVEFGAWDGRTLSNTYNLMAEKGWTGVFIEADPAKFKDLLVTYGENPRAKCLNCFVTFEGANSLDSLLTKAGAPKNLDLLSIDIDGNDYHVWESLVDHSPRVVVIEYNHTIPSHVEFIQPRDMSVQQGSAPLSLVKLGKKKGYELVCVTEYNLIFVQTNLFAAFGIADNSLVRLRSATDDQPYIFQLFDGTFVVGGMDRMCWHGIPIRQSKFQVLPKIFRRYPARPKNPLMRMLRRCWLFLYRKGLA